ncbi:MAG TPA: enoyl-CoA hydratase-related protein [Geobacteraceae bacterium]
MSLLSLMRPPVNALDQEALDELAEAIQQVDTDPATRVLIITSGINDIFCAGGDLKFWRGNQDAREVGGAGRKVFALIEQLSKPTIAAINGYAFGDGLSLALVCDLRFASEASAFRLPEAGYGFIPGWGPIQRLVALVGRAHAAELLLMCETIQAEQARMMGLINQTFPADRLLEEALIRAKRIADLSPAALHAAKCALSGEDEAACFEKVWGKADWREGIDALLAKRPPVFGSNENCMRPEKQRKSSEEYYDSIFDDAIFGSHGARFQAIETYAGK